ncbi:ACT domain-containing protein [Marinicrinis sediminis]|uniref:UPF0735 ACT domain-containing protein ACFSUC_02470 n=1 Tax=Marinicrinis sediminis TaxID=1652465 RepID=A0ABW5R677_9BACL
MTEKHTDRYYLVREDLLPEAVLKTIEAKALLAHSEVQTVHEAVERVGLSRSAFYKYKDGVFELNHMQQERIVTISLDLMHRSGILSRVLSMIAGHSGNVLTINQTIPLQGMANVVMSVDTSQMGAQWSALLHDLKEQEGVKRVQVVGQGAASY